MLGQDVPNGAFSAAWEPDQKYMLHSGYCIMSEQPEMLAELIPKLPWHKIQQPVEQLEYAPFIDNRFAFLYTNLQVSL